MQKLPIKIPLNSYKQSIFILSDGGDLQSAQVKLSLKVREGTQGDPNGNFDEGEGGDGGRLVQDISIYMV